MANKSTSEPVKAKESTPESDKIRPITTYYVPIKENVGFRFVVWPTNLSIEKVEKNLTTNRWDKLQSMSFTRRAVEFLATRAGSMLSEWDATAKKERGF